MCDTSSPPDNTWDIQKAFADIFAGKITREELQRRGFKLKYLPVMKVEGYTNAILMNDRLYEVEHSSSLVQGVKERSKRLAVLLFTRHRMEQDLHYTEEYIRQLQDSQYRVGLPVLTIEPKSEEALILRGRRQLEMEQSFERSLNKAYDEARQLQIDLENIKLKIELEE